MEINSNPDRRRVAAGLAAAALAVGIGRDPALATGFRSHPSTDSSPGCGLDLSSAPIRSVADWDRIYERYWGALGRQSEAQIHQVVHARNRVYDDTDAPFAWIVHYWLRAWATLADLTDDPKYLEMCVSFIDYMFDNTDERRVARGEIRENYVRDPLYLRGTGRGGPFWSRQGNASVLDTGQVVRGILAFVDLVFSNPDRWRNYAPAALRYFERAIIAADAFDNDWQVRGETGAYHYRDSAGSGELGTTRTAFNQSATMVAAHLMIHKWRPDPARADKVRRLARHWIEDYAVLQPDGAVTWRYILIPSDTAIEDAGHGTIDLEFLIPAYLSGMTILGPGHMNALAATFLYRLVDGSDGLNQFVDGSTGKNYAEHFNAGFGWFDLARFAPAVMHATLRIYAARYPPGAPGGELWARPMLGWANLLAAGRPCPG